MTKNSAEISLTESDINDIFIDRTIAFLNDLLEKDRDLVYALINTRHLCSPEVLDIPHIKVMPTCLLPFVKVGMLGILNGILGSIPDGKYKGCGYIASFVDGGRIVKFVRMDQELPENAEMIKHEGKVIKP